MASPPVLNQAIGHGSTGQSAAITAFPLSAIPTKPSLDKLAAAPNPIGGANPHPLARGFVLRRLSDAGPLILGRSLAPGRHPKPFTKTGRSQRRGVAANATPMADLRCDITVTCGKPNTGELSFVRAVIAGRWAWDLTIGIRRGAFADGVNLVGRHAEGDARLGRQSLGIAPLRAASGIQSRPAGLRSSTRETAG